MLRGLGFADEHLDRPLRTFSGGELTRASLARALGGDPDLLLLDEPTNHLDVASLEWLERELQSLDAAVILVAHDRWFLEAVTTATLEVVAGRGTFFPGPWHAWRREKAARALHAQKETQRIAGDIERLERFVERFRAKKDKAKQAQAKLTQIQRLQSERKQAADEVALLSRRTRTLGFEFLKPARSGRTVVEVEGVDVRIGERELLRGASFALERGEHVALVGPNGSGKTTLLETLLGRREAAKGKIQLGHGVAARVLLAAGGRARHARLRAPVRADDDEPRAPGRDVAARAASSSPAGTRSRSRWPCSRAASAAASRSRSPSRPARTSSCSTSRRTISTSRAARRSKPRSTRFPAPCCSSRTTAPCSTRSRSGRSRSRTASCTRTTAAGRRCCAGARSAPPGRRRRSRTAKKEKQPKAKPQRAPKPRPSELQRVEAEIATREAEVAELEVKLAEDWSNVDAMAAHKRSRDALQALLERWEELFEEAQA